MMSAHDTVSSMFPDARCVSTHLVLCNQPREDGVGVSIASLDDPHGVAFTVEMLASERAVGPA